MPCGFVWIFLHVDIIYLYRYIDKSIMLTYVCEYVSIYLICTSYLSIMELKQSNYTNEFASLM